MLLKQIPLHSDLDQWSSRISRTTIYRMQGRIAAFADDFFIINQSGDRLLKVRGKALRISLQVNETLDFEDLWGRQLFAIQEWMVRVKDSITIQGARGQTLASDVFGVEIEPGLDHGLILAITAAIDLMVHEG